MMMLISIIRFWYNGWIEKLYIDPHFHFHYYGFDWVSVPGGWTYALFLICGISAILVAVGYQYRLAIITFFLSFTYIELMDKTTYLNHYYFVSVLSFLMIWLPMHRYWSIDARRTATISSTSVSRWHILSIQLLLAIVYIYAGAAKLHHDWMIDALPLAIWLPSKFDFPLLGDIMHETWVHYLFSWGGAIYDLTIVFFLLWKRTRLFAYAMVILFHVMTGMLFPIGMFPYIMITSTLIFFDEDFHQGIIDQWHGWFGVSDKGNAQTSITDAIWDKISLPIVIGLMIVQLLFPLRYWLYDGNIFWNEQGYRFAWRVMLMEKTGYANFKIVNKQTGQRFYVQNEDFLTSFQQKQMSTQSDFIIEYGQYLGRHFESQGHENVGVYVESFAALNGRPSRPYFRDDIDIMQITRATSYLDYIIPFDE